MLGILFAFILSVFSLFSVLIQSQANFYRDIKFWLALTSLLVLTGVSYWA